jgi:PST family polysaccharide transporter
VSEPTRPPTPGLARGFLVGTLYLGFGNWLTSALNFAIFIAIARLLGPEDFGVYAFVGSINELLGIVGAFSIGAALIQSREESQRLYDTGFALLALLGAIAVVAAAAVAPFLYQLRSPTAAWFILVLAGCRVLTMLAAVPLAQLERALRYRRFALLGVVSGNVSNFSALGLALLGFGPWSLIGRDVLAVAITIVFAFAWSGYRYRGEVHREEARKLMDFARPMFLSRSLDIVFERMDRVAIGAWFGNAAVGLYQQARTLAETGHLVHRPISKLTLNLYSRLQDDPQRLSRSFVVTNYFLVRLMFAGAAVLIVFPGETIQLLLGEEWLAAAPTLRWLGLHAGILPVFGNALQLLYGRGAMWSNIRVRLLMVSLFAVAIAFAIRFASVDAIAVGLLVTTLSGLALALHFNRDVLGREVVGGLFAVPALCLVLTIAALFGAQRWLPLEELPLVALVPLPFLTYLALLAASERGRLLRELGYLRGHLAAGRGAP